MTKVGECVKGRNRQHLGALGRNKSQHCRSLKNKATENIFNNKKYFFPKRNTDRRSSRCVLKCSEAATVVHIGLLQIPLSSALHHSGFVKFVHLNVFCPPSGTRGCVRNVEQISCGCLASLPTPGCCWLFTAQTDTVPKLPYRKGWPTPRRGVTGSRPCTACWLWPALPTRPGKRR